MIFFYPFFVIVERSVFSLKTCKSSLYITIILCLPFMLQRFFRLTMYVLTLFTVVAMWRKVRGRLWLCHEDASNFIHSLIY